MIDWPYIRLDSSHPTAGSGWATPARRPSLVLVADAYGARVSGDEQRTWADPLAALEWMAQCFPEPGRWVGYLGYDLGRLFEDLPPRVEDDLGLPLLAMAFLPERSQPAEGSPSPPREASAPLTISSNFTRDKYLRTVQRAIDYIVAGDIFQVNLAQRLSVPTMLSPLQVYQRLLRDTPAWYGGLLDFGSFALVCNSPELFFRIEPISAVPGEPDSRNEPDWPMPGEPNSRNEPNSLRRITTRPIKGTRPGRPDMEEALRASLKDQAELNMIVDLERNDLGRICQIGSVRVTEPRVIEAHPTVYHGAATIEGRLRADVGFIDVLRAMFPGGSITGAPKIRAMQIIDELEPTRRGAYCGAIGYVDHTGLIEFNIAIRTMTMKDGVAYIPVGGGIVADSNPRAEYDETLTKARALLSALGVRSAS